MKIEIDQSGKIENTNKPTVVAFSGCKNKSLIIFGREKRKLLNHFRKMNKPSSFIYVTFAVLIHLLIKGERSIDEIIIDREYLGKEAVIKSYLIQHFKSSGRIIDKRRIYFREIGRKSAAHNCAVNSFREKRADMKVNSDDVIKVLQKTKSGVL